jgi:uncharacterized integral membrane protein
MTLGCVRAICKLVVTCYKLKHPARNLAEMINNGMKNLERERERVFWLTILVGILLLACGLVFILCYEQQNKYTNFIS